MLRFLTLFFVGVFLISNPGNVLGQLCSGSLGDAVFHINFGSPTNPQFVPPLAGYTFTSSTCPDDGLYTITDRTSGCFNNSWFTINSDRTGSGSFLLVNASYTPGDFFLTRIGGLCPGTTYEFAAWLMNVITYPSIRPNLLFTIETLSGTILQTYNTGDIPETTTPQWNQYGFFFTMPTTNEDIILRMRNNAPGGIGNDIAIDDITFRPCGPKITTQISGYGLSVDECQGEVKSYTLQAEVSDGFNVPAYQWQLSLDTGKNWQDIPGADSFTYTVSPVQPNIYLYRLSVAEQASGTASNCRVSSQPLTIHIHGNPIVDAGPDRSFFPGDTITIQPTVYTENPSFQWSPPVGLNNPAILSPLCYSPQDQTYTLTVTSGFGCISTDQMSVKLISGLYVPNAFTPNGDGLNDRWRAPGIDPGIGLLVQVFNVYGQEVYRVENDFINWDGKYKGTPQPQGNYIYHIRLNNGKKVFNGTLTLIR